MAVLGTFSIDDSNGSENVTFKMNWRFFFFQTLSRLFQFAENVKCRQISLELISWGRTQVYPERKFRIDGFHSDVIRLQSQKSKVLRFLIYTRLKISRK